MSNTIPLNAEQPIADVQGRADDRAVAIDRVGIRDIAHPVSIHGRDGTLRHSVGQFTMTVALPADRRGTHMSRFVELLNASEDSFNLTRFDDQVQEMTQRLDADTGHLTVDFPLFVPTRAPVSGVQALTDYAVTLRGIHEAGTTRTELQVVVPVTSLCPCSKEVSEYGAHNQRSLVTVSATHTTGSEQLWLEDLIDAVEREASAPVYPVLKRADEKFVTEAAYDNPKFVEDMVRDIALRLRSDDRVKSVRVACENLESIHNHSAYALIEHTEMNA